VHRALKGVPGVEAVRFDPSTDTFAVTGAPKAEDLLLRVRRAVILPGLRRRLGRSAER
jgi:hypothetical protein